MFRAQQNPFDDAVAKATDENLTSENWEYIMDVCDKVASEESGAKDVVASLIKRLAHRNANVQLYTLELANALSQNCGAKMHRELSSRSFTDSLLRLANDRTTHQQVKAKILERMAEWAEMFASNPDLGIMEQQYMKLKSQNPNLHPPSKPHKHEITDFDRQKEEEELQMALALSVKANQASAAASTSGQPAGSSSAAGSSSSMAPTASQPLSSGTTAATVSRVRALFDFQPSEPSELQFRKGDIIAVLESVYKDWWKGSLRGQTGIFPLNYVEKLSDPTPEEIRREAQMEAEVFAEIKNVEKLLALLSTSSSELNVQENEEITTLYHSTLAIRPKLIELIGKYSQKKDDFTQLNEKFIKARRDYESLLEASMSQPSQPQYSRPAQGTYGYGGGGRLGYPPQGVSQPDSRYYTSGPQDPQAIPTNGPAPFHLVGQTRPGSSVPGQPQASGERPLTSGSGSHSPTLNTMKTARPTDLNHASQDHPAGSRYGHPQELATSAYPSPIEGSHIQNLKHPQSLFQSSVPPPQREYPYPDSSLNPRVSPAVGYPTPQNSHAGAGPPPPSSSQPDGYVAYGSAYPPSRHVPRPSSSPPPPLAPSAAGASYPVLNAPASGPDGRYQAYGSGGGGGGAMTGPADGGGGGGSGGGSRPAGLPHNPNDFYHHHHRPGTNEMFLPGRE